jgi:ribonuclease R
MKEFFDGDVIEGTFYHKNGNGSGLFKSEDGFKFYISKKDRRQALHEDLVRVELISQPNRSTLSAKILAVLERTNKTLVGTIDKRQKTCFFIPDIGGTDFHVKREYQNGVSHGDRVKAELLEWNPKKRRPEGKVVHIFGKSGEHEAEIQSIISKFNVQEDFPEEVLAEANAIPMELDENEVKNRIDLRDTFTFTIDPETARDFDDSISFEPIVNGWFSLGIHIADVTHFVRPNSELDKEAYQRATSIYLVDRVIPMLPRSLSNGVCSLRPDEDKYTFSYMCEISLEGKVRNEKFARTATRSNVRLNYAQAQEMIDNGSCEGFEEKTAEVVKTCDKISKNLRKERMKKKALEFHSRQPKFILDKEGTVIDIEYDDAHDAHQLIEDLMLLANRKVSKFISDRPSVYRSHDEPAEEKLFEVKVFLDKMGYELDTSGGDATKESINKIMDDLKGMPEETMVSTLLVRTMSKAYYTPFNIGHYGLGFEFYTHFTSPIRRYPDMMVHRLLHEKLTGTREIKVSKLDAKSKHCSSKEVYAANAQRESVAYKQAEWMSDKIGDKFEAILTDVKKWGIYVELTESGCRGLIPQAVLNEDGYSLDEENFRIEGQDGNKLTLGDVVQVECVSVDLQMRLIDFKL